MGFLLRFSVLSFVLLSTINVALGAVSPERLSGAVKESRARIYELTVIKKVLEKHGVRGWLVGGSATAVARYTLDDLERADGERAFIDEKFDYDFYSVFRMTQDVDIAIDGNQEQAAAVQADLERLLPYTMPDFLVYKGHYSIWEVRLLRGDINGKVAILDNPQFFQQHSDSDSNGALEITDPPARETVLRDVRQWDAMDRNRFVEAVLSRDLHYYYSEKHNDTARAQRGKNPEIMSVVRYLAKHFQYGTHTERTAIRQLASIVDRFDPRELGDRDESGMLVKHPGVPYALDRLRRLATKLLLTARDREKAWNALIAMKLLEKLASIDDPKQKESLAWYLRHPPLLSSPLGEVGGETAEKLALGTMLFEVSDYLTYESLWHAPAGEPNFPASSFKIDDKKVRGVLLRPEAARRSLKNLPIRVRLDPRAVVGVDFVRHEDGVVVTNRAALVVESVDLSPSALVYYSELRDGQPFDFEDERVATHVRRRVLSSLYRHPSSVVGVAGIVARELKAEKPSERLLAEWFRQPASARQPELLDVALARGGAVANAVLGFVWRNRAWAPLLVSKLPESLAARLAPMEETKEEAAGYLSTNAEALQRWLQRAMEMAPSNDTVLVFLEGLQEATEKNKVTRRDFRRLVARALAHSSPDEAFLARFSRLFARSPQLQWAFTVKRGVFVDSSQGDAKAVEAAFLVIEKSLVCSNLLVMEAKKEEEGK